MGSLERLQYDSIPTSYYCGVLKFREKKLNRVFGCTKHTRCRILIIKQPLPVRGDAGPL